MSPSDLNILVAFEYSGIVRDSFTSSGCNAVSCDLEPSLSPGHHLQCDVLSLDLSQFHLIIAHPPCTFLCKAQQWRCHQDKDRMSSAHSAFDFFMKLYLSPVHYVCCENPPGFINSWFRPPDQICYPYNFGNSHRKEIGLWLKNLPPLISTCVNTIHRPMSNHTNNRMTQHERSQIKSKFFPEVAAAMAEQWISFILSELSHI